MGISIWQLLIVLLIIVLLFGTKKLKNIGSDLGGAFKGFKSALDDEEKKAQEQAQGRVIEGEKAETHNDTETTKEKQNS